MRDMVPFLDVPLEQVMTPQPATVGPEDAIEDAAGLMAQGGFRHVPVVDPDGRLVGMLSERDVRGRLGVEVERFADAAEELLQERVDGAMRIDPVTVPARASVRDALEILLDERIGALPVVEGERLVGIVSYLDLLAYLLREAPEAPAVHAPAIRHATTGPKKRPRMRVAHRGGAR